MAEEKVSKVVKVDVRTAIIIGILSFGVGAVQNSVSVTPVSSTTPVVQTNPTPTAAVVQQVAPEK